MDEWILEWIKSEKSFVILTEYFVLHSFTKIFILFRTSFSLDVEIELSN